MDFPVTRSVLEQADLWVTEFAAAQPQAVRVPAGPGFRWEHPTKTAEAVQVAKAVRALSGLHGALLLADNAYTVECGSLLRMVADFSAEIVYVGEGLAEGRLTSDQERFVEQHFVPLPEDPDALAAREREYYVGRKDMAKAQRRLSEKFGAPGDLAAKIGAYLNKGYDAYVHGSNQSAMELYTGRNHSFMLRGHESARFVCMAKTSVAGKLKEFLNSLRMMALTRGSLHIDAQIREAFDTLSQSREDAGAQCIGLS